MLRDPDIFPLVGLATFTAALLIAVLLLRRAGVRVEGRSYEDVFSREVELSITAQLKLFLTQLKLLTIRASTLVLVAIMVLLFMLALPWAPRPHVESAEYAFLARRPLQMLVALSPGGMEVGALSKFLIASLSRAKLSSPIVVLLNTTGAEIEDVILVNCTRPTALHVPLLSEVCLEDRVLLIGADVAEEGKEVAATVIYGQHSHNVLLRAYKDVSHLYLVPGLLSLTALLQLDRGTAPVPVAIVGPFNPLSTLIEGLGARPHSVIVALDEGESRNLLEALIALGANEIYEVLEDRCVKYFVKPPAPYETVLTVLLFTALLATMFVLDMKSSEDVYMSYVYATTISGGTEWEAKKSLTVAASLSLMAASLLSLFTALFCTLFAEGTISPHGLFVCFASSIAAPCLTSITYLRGLLYEKPSYHIEKLPPKGLLEYALSGHSSAGEVLKRLVQFVRESEFFTVVEESLKAVERGGTATAFLRALYNRAFGMGVDVVIVCKSREGAVTISLDVNPWSAEDVSRRALETVARLMASRIVGFIEGSTHESSPSVSGPQAVG